MRDSSINGSDNVNRRRRRGIFRNLRAKECHAMDKQKREAIQGASHLSNQIQVLRCLSLSLGVEYLLVTPDVNFDLLGLGFRLLAEIYVQHALVIVGAHLGGIH
jgi:hypothetical protein